ncbi:hypothetical protein DY000_02013309 [Brassica cretica]|uniref:Uncharacterized protein n=1 Tax=Brassica cretica TaxID=69181 RepID=A0ABQ7CZI2_BRACR|nr:hypothetical protein DY000_02013309 [Brassica cretica]
MHFSLCRPRALQIIDKLLLPPHKCSSCEIPTNSGRKVGESQTTAACFPIEFVYVIAVTSDPRHLLR